MNISSLSITRLHAGLVGSALERGLTVTVVPSNKVLYVVSDSNGSEDFWKKLSEHNHDGHTGKIGADRNDMCADPILNVFSRLLVILLL